MRITRTLERFAVVAVVVASLAALFVLHGLRSADEAHFLILSLTERRSALENWLRSQLSVDSPLNRERIYLDLRRPLVEPAEWTEQVFSALEFRARRFDQETLAILQRLLKTAEPDLLLTLLPRYLDDSIDQFVYEKAVITLRLIRELSRQGRPVNRECESFRRLVTGIPQERERRELRRMLDRTLREYSLSETAVATPVDEINPRKSALLEMLPLIVHGRSGEFLWQSVNDGSQSVLLVAAALGQDRFVAACLDPAQLIPAARSRFNLELQSAGLPTTLSLADPWSLDWSVAPVVRSSSQAVLVYLPLLVLFLALGGLWLREKQARALGERMAGFAAGVAHQLKTPLSAALVHLELAERHFAAGNSDQARESLQEAEKRSRDLAFLFENFSALDRLFHQGGVQLEQRDLRQEVETYLRTREADREAGRLHWSVDVPVGLAIVIDPWAFYHILHNLVDNALRHGREVETQSVILSITVPVNNSRWVEVEIRDNGPGIPVEITDSIFDRFVHGSETQSAHAGSGLGLAIARGLAEKMNGRLTLSGPGPGAGFVLELPAGKGEAT